jgi:hypothetical protein
MEVGTISPEGYHQWDGEKWLPVELGKISEDGFWIWNGERWVVNRGLQSQTPIEESNKVHSEDKIVEQTQITQNHEMMILQIDKKKSNFPSKLSLFILIPIAIVAILVVVSGVVYVMMGDSIYSENDRTIEGSWYSPYDTITFFPNGTVSESTGIATNWSIEGENLTMTLKFDDDEVDLTWIYEIKFDDQGDSFLIMALYEIEDGTHTNVVNGSTCVGYSDSITGSENENFDDRLVIFPEWCNPEDN